MVFSKMKVVMNRGCILQSQTATLQGIWSQEDINQPSVWKLKQINVLKYENFISYWTDE